MESLFQFLYLHSSSVSSLFFVFFAISFSLILFFLHRKLWCSCGICSTYLSSKWTSQFPNLCDWYTHLLRHSPTQTITVHVLGNTITANPDNVEHILKSRFDNYPKGKQFSAILGDLLGKGIFNADGDSWMFQRKLASLELGSVSVRTFAFATVAAEIETRLLPLLSSHAGGEALDLQDVFRRFSFDNICKFSFGLDPGCLESSLPISEFAESFDLASRLSAGRAMATSPAIWKVKRLLNLGSERRLKKALKVVNVLATEVILQKRKLGFANQQDLLSRFMACVNDDSYLRDIVVCFILAGRDTMASGLTNFFWLLAKHPHVAAKIRSESSWFVEPGRVSASYDKIRDMHYLHAAASESLRLYPPVQFDSKFARKSDVLPDGTLVRKGTRVTYHPYAMGRMESIWGLDCLEYKPERWLKDGVFYPQNPYKYSVFQGGIRVCLGKEMALMEMKTVALSILEKFDLKLVAHEDSLRFEPGLTAMVKGGVHVRVKAIAT